MLSRYCLTLFNAGLEVEEEVLPVTQENIPYKVRIERQQKAYRHLKQRKVKGFSTLIDDSELDTGTSAMLCVVGAGKMRPNILLMGYKNDWRTCEKSELEKYFATIQ